MLCNNLFRGAALLCLFAASASAGIIQDSGFESANSIIYSPGAIGDGWNVTTGTIAIMNNSQGYGFAQAGLQFADLDNGGLVNTLSQTILGTIPGQSYAISFYLADDVGGNALTVMFGGTTLMNVTTAMTGTGIYSYYTFNANATSTSTDLTFAGQYQYFGAGVGTVLDTVSVTGPISTGTTTPEPATAALSALALVGLAAERLTKTIGR